MPNRCVAAGCSKCASDGVSLFRFPRSPGRRKTWARQVQRTRDMWSPTPSSVLCSDHFEPDCFEVAPNLKENFGLAVQHKRILNNTAVPSIFKRSIKPRASPKAKPRVSPKPKAKPKVCSAALVKLSRKREVEEILTSPVGVDADVDLDGNNAENSKNVSCQTSSDLGMRNKSTTARILPKSRSVSTQTEVSAIDCQCQHATSKGNTTSASITAPGESNKEPDASSSSESESDASSSESEPDASSSSESEPDGSSSDSSDSDKSFCPSSSYSDSDIYSDDSEVNDYRFSHQNVSCDKQDKFIVFNNNLVSLLRWCHCPECGEKDIWFSKKVVGTMLVLTLHCKGCPKSSKWTSQPYEGSYPAGNILLSAGILFAGASPTKVLRVLRHINVASITTRTFFRHQKNLLIPAVEKVWSREQIEILTVLHLEGKKLVLSGDGRADSPGHSAKYGTYSVMEMQSNLIIAIEVVQSNECGGSPQMEMEGLVRIVAFLESHHLEIGTLITDRHRAFSKA